MSSFDSNPTPDTPAPSFTPRRSFAVVVLGDTFSRTGARIGLMWICIIVFCAVFAPAIASSHPFVMKTTAGEKSYPWFEHLTPADVTLFALIPIAITLLLLKRLDGNLRLLILASCAIVLTFVFSFVIRPPQTIDYKRYRVMEAAGEIEWAFRAPIPYSPSDYQRDKSDQRIKEPGNGHWLGTDSNSSDVAARLIHACRLVLTIGFISTGIAVTIGVVMGGLMGYFAKTVDLLGMRMVEIIEAIPQLYLLLTFVAFFPGDPVILGVTLPRMYMLMAIIGLTSWSGYARYIRAEFLRLRKQDFVQAAVACGLPVRSILFKHMLPNGIAPVLVGASFGVASAILVESFLSFLGLGLMDQPSWGGLLKQALGDAGKFSWWIATFPGLAIFLTVFSYNMVGEALRDAIDPHTQRLNRAGS